MHCLTAITLWHAHNWDGLRHFHLSFFTNTLKLIYKIPIISTPIQNYNTFTSAKKSFPSHNFTVVRNCLRHLHWSPVESPGVILIGPREGRGGLGGVDAVTARGVNYRTKHGTKPSVTSSMPMTTIAKHTQREMSELQPAQTPSPDDTFRTV